MQNILNIIGNVWYYHVISESIGGAICRATDLRFTGHGFESWIHTIV